MKISYLIPAAMFLCSCVCGCNTEDAEEVFNEDEEAVVEKGYEDDGSGDAVDVMAVTTKLVISFSGASASVEGVAENVAVSIDGADVVVRSQADSMEFVVKGSSSDGSLKLYSEKKFTLSLDGLSLNSAKGAAINNQSKKKLVVHVVDGSVNTLSDASNHSNVTDGEDSKACFFSEGQMVFYGGGCLNVTGNYKHAIASDDYVSIQGDVEINVLGSVKDGIHANDFVAIKGGATSIKSSGSDGIDVDAGYFFISNGSLDVAVSGESAKAVKSAGNLFVHGGVMSLVTSGAAVYDSQSRDYSVSSGLKADSSIVFNGGIVSVTCSGVGAKGVKADGDITVNGGTISVMCSGASRSGYYAAKGIKAEENFTVNDGRVYAKSASHEAIESKNIITINGGVVEAEASDDAINADSHFYVKGGYVYAHSTNNDGLDANGNLVLSGGSIVAHGASQPECGLDANEEGGYKLYITGATVIGIGGGTSYPSSTSGAQAAVAFSASASNMALKDASGSVVLAWDYSKSSALYDANKSAMVLAGPGGMAGGGMGGGSTVLISTPEMVIGDSYTLYTGVTVAGNNLFHGLSTSASITGGSSVGLASASVSAGGSSGFRF